MNIQRVSWAWFVNVQTSRQGTYPVHSDACRPRYLSGHADAKLVVPLCYDTNTDIGQVVVSKWIGLEVDRYSIWVNFHNLNTDDEYLNTNNKAFIWL